MATEATEVASKTGGGIHRSLHLSLIATASVAVIPTFFSFAVLVFSQAEPMLLAAIGLSILLTAGAVVTGSAIWARQPESAGVSFGDLMLWSWIRQYQAERTLHRASGVLGFDRTGNFLGHSTAPDAEQVRAMRAIAKALDAKSTYTLGHSARVAKHARKVARELEFPEERTHALALAAELHDVGNITLPEEILRKAGKLTVQERSEMEGHVLLGARMVEKAGSSDVVDGIKSHHERFDGQGYPEHLSGEQIPAFARIIAIAEAYDAMTSTRPYRQSFSKQHAIEALRAGSGTQFDGALVDAFVATLRNPVPFIGDVPFLAAVQGQVRELFLVIKRVGAVAVSATASTIAIALILGGTTLSPGTWDRFAPDFLDRRSDQKTQLNRAIADDQDGDSMGDGADPDLDSGSFPASEEVLGVRFERGALGGAAGGTPGTLRGGITGGVVPDDGGRSGGGESPDDGGSEPGERPPPDGGTEPPPPDEPDPDDGGAEEPTEEPEPEPEPDEDRGKGQEKPDKDEGKGQEKPDKDDGKP